MTPEASGVSTPLLDVRDVSVRFGGVTAVETMSMSVGAGQICGLIGPNGAGKTTMFNTITRNVEAASGSVSFDGRDVLSMRADHLAGLGLRRTFQNLALFESMTVRENVTVGAHSRGRSGWLHALSRLGIASEERRLQGAADEAVEMLGLGDVADEPVAHLPFGTLKRVELARALASSPRMILLDEPANGLRESEVDELADILGSIRDDLGITVLLVDHHVRLIMSLCDSVVAMAAGRLIVHGTPAEVRSNDEVRRVFLGEVA
jgi:branched-chain amino acid transport system ATP-binding protein